MFGFILERLQTLMRTSYGCSAEADANEHEDVRMPRNARNELVRKVLEKVRKRMQTSWDAPCVHLDNNAGIWMIKSTE